MKSRSSIIAALLLAGCSSSEPELFPEPDTLPSIQLAEVAESTIPFGQPVDLHLRITSETPLEALTPENWLEPGVTLLDERLEEPVMEDVWQQHLSLTVAVYAVTNTPVFVSTPLAELAEQPLPFLALEVTSRLSDEDEVPTFGKESQPDFRGPEALRRRKQNLILTILVVTLLWIGIAVASWLLLKREKPLPPPVPAHVVALERLKHLMQTPIWAEQQVEAVTVELSLILREYIEGRFGIQAPDLTTEEFLIEVDEHAPWSEQEQAGLASFFDAADRIKYAGDRPAGAILEELYSSVSTFVSTTREPSE